MILYNFLEDKNAVDNTFSDGLGSWRSTDFVKRTGPGRYNNVGPREGVQDAGIFITHNTLSNHSVRCDRYIVHFSLESLIKYAG